MELSFKDENKVRIFTATHHGNVLGYVAIDSTVGGRSCGGLRMLPDIDEAEIRALARSMTLKYGFLGLPQGGAKAGVIGNPEAPEAERLKRLAEFGHAIADLLRTRAYIPNADMGTQNNDIRYMLNALGIRVGRRELQGNSSGYYTAHSVLAGVVQSARHIGLNLSKCTAAIEGFGNVGKPLASLLSREGIKILAISTSRGGLYNSRGLDVARLVRLADEEGSRVVEVYREAEVIQTVLEELGRSSVSADLARSMWEQAKTFRIKRINPIWTRGGKLMPLRLMERGLSSEQNGLTAISGPFKQKMYFPIKK